MHLNSSYTLPPVDCPLLILVDDKLVEASRPTFVEYRGDELVFILAETGQEIQGRFPWTYP